MLPDLNGYQFLTLCLPETSVPDQKFVISSSWGVVEAEALDGSEDVFGRLGPAKGLGFGVVGGDEGLDAAAYLAPLRTIEWIVYAKRPFAGPEAVLAYLSRYTHRVAIANSRLIALDDAGVTFRWKDYRAKGRERSKVMTLAVDEFIRRFLIHVLPSGFHRIRHYRLFANGGRAENIARARQLLNVPAMENQTGDADSGDDGELQRSSHPCPCCGGRMIIIETLERGAAPRYRPAAPIRIDSS